MNLTQFLNFEIGRSCDLAREHKSFCPSIDRDRYGTLSIEKILKDELIIESIKYAVNLGFKGFIGFHYYNEPTLFFDRIMRIVAAVENIYDTPRFCLWTNGTYLDENLDNLKHFERIVISNYQKKDWSYIEKFMKKNGELQTMGGELDQRKYNFDIDDEVAPCFRPLVELIIDYYGNGHMCCMDWKGEINLGNIQIEGFKYIVDKFLQVRDQLLLSPISEESPLLCKQCKMKLKFIPMNDKTFYPKTKKYVDILRRNEEHKNQKLISKEYKKILQEIHLSVTPEGKSIRWGNESMKPWMLEIIERHIEENNVSNILDYGSGYPGLKSVFGEKYNVTEYDPGIEIKSKTPEPQEYVVCTDVLEHIEPEFIDNVLDDLKRVVTNKGFFTISCRDALMILSDGRNAHLIQKPREWWKEKLLKRFNIIEETYIYSGKEQLRVLVGRKEN
tara:strand:- start:3010 stop:4344 length:1335 start_codon:yes stop_codon:yes gene_type:complete